MNTDSRYDRHDESVSTVDAPTAETTAVDSAATETASPSVDRTNQTVTEIMGRWPMKRFAFAMPRSLYGYTLGLIAVFAVTLTLTLLLLIGGRSVWFTAPVDTPADEKTGGVAADEGDRPYADGKSGVVKLPWAEQVQVIPAGSITATHAALADLQSGEIIASRKADERIYPASMTKVMTLIVVVENLPHENSLKDTVTVSQAVYDEMKRQGSSGVGLEPGETLTVESLLYALMLKSDGIAACELARYVAGSEEDFVELMNQKAEKMGLTDTHFMNPTGLFHENHYSTAREIASIMAYAMDMSLCRRVLMTQSYNATATDAKGESFNYFLYHSLIVTQFEKVTPNQPSAVTVLAGKTGFTDESQYCLVTYAQSADGHGYVCVTVEGNSYASCIADYITVYNTYAKP